MPNNKKMELWEEWYALLGDPRYAGIKATAAIGQAMALLNAVAFAVAAELGKPTDNATVARRSAELCNWTASVIGLPVRALAMELEEERDAQ
jgi:hypothetical protein